MLGAALAGAAAQVDAAGVGSYKFFNGAEPNVKIVVGKDGRDGVAAGILAAKIGNLARTDRDISVVGKDGVGCTVGAGANGTSGACTLSDKKVSLEITTPGVNPQVAYQMKTYIQGFLDSTLTDDRVDSMPGNTILGLDSTTGGRKVTFTESPMLATRGTITDPVSGKTYTEEERYYLYSQANYYQTDKQVEAQNTQLAYEALFTNPIQRCTEFTPDDSTCMDQFDTARHRMVIKLFGQDWVLFKMDGFDTGLASNTEDAGSSIDLGKAVAFKEFMQIGDTVTAPNGVKIELSSISGFGFGGANQPLASFNVYDASGNKIDTATLQEGGATEYNKYGVVVKLFKAFPGVNQVNYAQVYVFSDKLTLNDAQVVDTNNQDWNVRLITGGASYGASLAKIQLIRQVVSQFLKAGEGVNILNQPAQMRFTFNGLEDVASDTLALNGVGGLTLASSSTASITGTFVRITSGRSNAFQFAGTSDSANTVYLLVGNAGGTSPTAGGTPVVGAFVYQIPGSSNYRTYFSPTSVGASTFATALAITGTGMAGVTVSDQSTNGACGTWTNNTAVTAFTGTTVLGNVTTLTGNFTQTGGMLLSGFNNAVAAQNSTNVSLTSVTFANGTVATPNVFCTLNWIGWTNGTVTGGVNTVTFNDLTYLYGTQSQMVRVNTAGILGAGIDPAGSSALGGAAIAVQEFLLDTEAGQTGAFLLPVGRTGATETPVFLGASATARIDYDMNWVPNVTTANWYGNTTALAAWDSGFISPRGSVATVSTSSASIKYATILSHALFTLSAASANVTGNKATADFKTGETALDSAGYKVKVIDVKASSSATGGSAGSSGACQLTGMDGLKASETKATVVSDVNSGLVVYDDDPAAASANAIAVGGGMVNARTKSAFGDASLDTNAVATVKVQGNTLGVWGGKQADTLEAAQALVAWLDSNKANLVR